MKNKLLALFLSLVAVFALFGMTACKSGEETPPAPDYGTLSISDIELDVGETVAINPIFSKTDYASTISYTFTGNSISIANGEVTGLAEGEVTVTAKTQYHTTTFDVTVNEEVTPPPVVKDYTFDIADIVIVGLNKTATINAVFADAANAEAITYTLPKEQNVVSIANGVVTAENFGTVEVSATSEHNTTPVVFSVTVVDPGEFNVSPMEIAYGVPTEIVYEFTNSDYASEITYNVVVGDADAVVIEGGYITGVKELSTVVVNASTANGLFSENFLVSVGPNYGELVIPDQVIYTGAPAANVAYVALLQHEFTVAKYAGNITFTLKDVDGNPEATASDKIVIGGEGGEYVIYVLEGATAGVVNVTAKTDLFEVEFTVTVKEQSTLGSTTLTTVQEVIDTYAASAYNAAGVTLYLGDDALVDEDFLYDHNGALAYNFAIAGTTTHQWKWFFQHGLYASANSPKNVVTSFGANDLANGASAEAVIAEIKAFFDMYSSMLPSNLYWVAIQGEGEAIAQVNEAILAYAEATGNVTVVDAEGLTAIDIELTAKGMRFEVMEPQNPQYAVRDIVIETVEASSTEIKYLEESYLIASKLIVTEANEDAVINVKVGNAVIPVWPITLNEDINLTLLVVDNNIYATLNGINYVYRCVENATEVVVETSGVVATFNDVTIFDENNGASEYNDAINAVASTNNAELTTIAPHVGTVVEELPVVDASNVGAGTYYYVNNAKDAIAGEFALKFEASVVAGAGNVTLNVLAHGEETALATAIVNSDVAAVPNVWEAPATVSANEFEAYVIKHAGLLYVSCKIGDAYCNIEPVAVSAEELSISFTVNGEELVYNINTLLETNVTEIVSLIGTITGEAISRLDVLEAYNVNGSKGLVDGTIVTLMQNDEVKYSGVASNNSIRFVGNLVAGEYDVVVEGYDVATVELSTTGGYVTLYGTLFADKGEFDVTIGENGFNVTTDLDEDTAYFANVTNGFVIDFEYVVVAGPNLTSDSYPTIELRDSNDNKISFQICSYNNAVIIKTINDFGEGDVTAEPYRLGSAYELTEAVEMGVAVLNNNLLLIIEGEIVGVIGEQDLADVATVSITYDCDAANDQNDWMFKNLTVSNINSYEIPEDVSLVYAYVESLDKNEYAVNATVVSFSTSKPVMGKDVTVTVTVPEGYQVVSLIDYTTGMGVEFSVEGNTVTATTLAISPYAHIYVVIAPLAEETEYTLAIEAGYVYSNSHALAEGTVVTFMNYNNGYVMINGVVDENGLVSVNLPDGGYVVMVDNIAYATCETVNLVSGNVNKICLAKVLVDYEYTAELNGWELEEGLNGLSLHKEANIAPDKVFFGVGVNYDDLVVVEYTVSTYGTSVWAPLQSESVSNYYVNNGEYNKKVYVKGDNNNNYTKSNAAVNGVASIHVILVIEDGKTSIYYENTDGALSFVATFNKAPATGSRLYIQPDDCAGAITFDGIKIYEGDDARKLLATNVVVDENEIGHSNVEVSADVIELGKEFTVTATPYADKNGVFTIVAMGLLVNDGENVILLNPVIDPVTGVATAKITFNGFVVEGVAGEIDLLTVDSLTVVVETEYIETLVNVTLDVNLIKEAGASAVSATEGKTVTLSYNDGYKSIEYVTTVDSEGKAVFNNVYPASYTVTYEEATLAQTITVAEDVVGSGATTQALTFTWNPFVLTPYNADIDLSGALNGQIAMVNLEGSNVKFNFHEDLGDIQYVRFTLNEAVLYNRGETALTMVRTNGKVGNNDLDYGTRWNPAGHNENKGDKNVADFQYRANGSWTSSLIKEVASADVVDGLAINNTLDIAVFLKDGKAHYTLVSADGTHTYVPNFGAYATAATKLVGISSTANYLQISNLVYYTDLADVLTLNLDVNGTLNTEGETSITAEGEGTVSVEASFYGEINISAVAEEGYQLTSLIVNGVNYVSNVVDGELTIENLNKPVLNVVAQFDEIEGDVIESAVTVNYVLEASYNVTGAPADTEVFYIYTDGQPKTSFSPVNGVITANLVAGETYLISSDEYETVSFVAAEEVSVTLLKKLFKLDNDKFDVSVTENGYNISTNESGALITINSSVEVKQGFTLMFNFDMFGSNWTDAGANKSNQAHVSGTKTQNVINFNLIDSNGKMIASQLCNWNDILYWKNGGENCETVVLGKAHSFSGMYAITVIVKDGVPGVRLIDLESMTVVGDVMLGMDGKSKDQIGIDLADIAGFSIDYDGGNTVNKNWQISNLVVAYIDLADVSNADENANVATLTVDKASVQLGDVVTVTATAEDGYVLSNISVNGRALDLVYNEDGSVSASFVDFGEEEFIVSAAATAVEEYPFTITFNSKFAWGADLDVLDEGTIVTLTDTLGNSYEYAVDANSKAIVYIPDGDYVVTADGYEGAAAFTMSHGGENVGTVTLIKDVMPNETIFTVVETSADGATLVKSKGLKGTTDYKAYFTNDIDWTDKVVITYNLTMSVSGISYVNLRTSGNSYVNTGCWNNGEIQVKPLNKYAWSVWNGKAGDLNPDANYVSTDLTYVLYNDGTQYVTEVYSTNPADGVLTQIAVLKGADFIAPYYQLDHYAGEVILENFKILDGADAEAFLGLGTLTVKGVELTENAGEIKDGDTVLGTVVVSASKDINYKDVVTVTVTPTAEVAEGETGYYAVSYIKVNGKALDLVFDGTAATVSFVNDGSIFSDVAFEVETEIKHYATAAVTVELTEGSTAMISNDQTVDFRGQASATITVATGTAVYGVTVNGKAVEATTEDGVNYNVTFTADDATASVYNVVVDVREISTVTATVIAEKLGEEDYIPAGVTVKLIGVGKVYEAVVAEDGSITFENVFAGEYTYEADNYYNSLIAGNDAVVVAAGEDLETELKLEYAIVSEGNGVYGVADVNDGILKGQKYQTNIFASFNENLGDIKYVELILHEPDAIPGQYPHQKENDNAGTGVSSDRSFLGFQIMLTDGSKITPIALHNTQDAWRIRWQQNGTVGWGAIGGNFTSLQYGLFRDLDKGLKMAVAVIDNKVCIFIDKGYGTLELIGTTDKFSVEKISAIRSDMIGYTDGLVISTEVPEVLVNTVVNDENGGTVDVATNGITGKMTLNVSANEGYTVHYVAVNGAKVALDNGKYEVANFNTLIGKVEVFFAKTLSASDDVEEVVEVRNLEGNLVTIRSNSDNGVRGSIATDTNGKFSITTNEGFVINQILVNGVDVTDSFVFGANEAYPIVKNGVCEFVNGEAVIDVDWREVEEAKLLITNKYEYETAEEARPLTNVTVTLVGVETYTRVTDSEGYISIFNVKDGSYVLTANVANNYPITVDVVDGQFVLDSVVILRKFFNGTNQAKYWNATSVEGEGYTIYNYHNNNSWSTARFVDLFTATPGNVVSFTYVLPADVAANEESSFRFKATNNMEISLNAINGRVYLAGSSYGQRANGEAYTSDIVFANTMSNVTLSFNIVMEAHGMAWYDGEGNFIIRYYASNQNVANASFYHRTVNTAGAPVAKYKLTDFRIRNMLDYDAANVSVGETGDATVTVNGVSEVTVANNETITIVATPSALDKAIKSIKINGTEVIEGAAINMANGVATYCFSLYTYVDEAKDLVIDVVESDAILVTVKKLFEYESAGAERLETGVKLELDAADTVKYSGEYFLIEDSFYSVTTDDNGQFYLYDVAPDAYVTTSVYTEVNGARLEGFKNTTLEVTASTGSTLELVATEMLFRENTAYNNYYHGSVTAGEGFNLSSPRENSRYLNIPAYVFKENAVLSFNFTMPDPGTDGNDNPIRYHAYLNIWLEGKGGARYSDKLQIMTWGGNTFYAKNENFNSEISAGTNQVSLGNLYGKTYELNLQYIDGKVVLFDANGLYLLELAITGNEADYWQVTFRDFPNANNTGKIWDWDITDLQVNYDLDGIDAPIVLGEVGDGAEATLAGGASDNVLGYNESATINVAVEEGKAVKSVIVNKTIDGVVVPESVNFTVNATTGEVTYTFKRNNKVDSYEVVVETCDAPVITLSALYEYEHLADGYTPRTVANVSIKLDGANDYIVTTDANGQFYLYDVRNATYTVTSQYGVPNYETSTNAKYLLYKGLHADETGTLTVADNVVADAELILSETFYRQINSGTGYGVDSTGYNLTTKTWQWDSINANVYKPGSVFTFTINVPEDSTKNFNFRIGNEYNNSDSTHPQQGFNIANYINKSNAQQVVIINATGATGSIKTGTPSNTATDVYLGYLFGNSYTFYVEAPDYNTFNIYDAEGNLLQTFVKNDKYDASKADSPWLFTHFTNNEAGATVTDVRAMSIFTASTYNVEGATVTTATSFAGTTVIKPTVEAGKVVTGIKVDGKYVPLTLDADGNVVAEIVELGVVDKPVHNVVIETESVAANAASVAVSTKYGEWETVSESLNGKVLSIVSTSGDVQKTYLATVENDTLTANLADGDYVVTADGFVPAALTVGGASATTSLVIYKDYILENEYNTPGMVTMTESLTDGTTLALAVGQPALTYFDIEESDSVVMTFSLFSGVWRRFHFPDSDLKGYRDMWFYANGSGASNSFGYNYSGGSGNVWLEGGTQNLILVIKDGVYSLYAKTTNANVVDGVYFKLFGGYNWNWDSMLSFGNGDAMSNANQNALLSNVKVYSGENAEDYIDAMINDGTVTSDTNDVVSFTKSANKYTLADATEFKYAEATVKATNDPLTSTDANYYAMERAGFHLTTNGDKNIGVEFCRGVGAAGAMDWSIRFCNAKWTQSYSLSEAQKEAYFNDGIKIAFAIDGSNLYAFVSDPTTGKLSYAGVATGYNATKFNYFGINTYPQEVVYNVNLLQTVPADVLAIPVANKTLTVKIDGYKWATTADDQAIPYTLGGSFELKTSDNGDVLATATCDANGNLTFNNVPTLNGNYLIRNTTNKVSEFLTVVDNNAEGVILSRSLSRENDDFKRFGFEFGNDDGYDIILTQGAKNNTNDTNLGKWINIQADFGVGSKFGFTYDLDVDGANGSGQGSKFNMRFEATTGYINCNIILNNGLLVLDHASGMTTDVKPIEGEVYITYEVLADGVLFTWNQPATSKSGEHKITAGTFEGWSTMKLNHNATNANTQLALRDFRLLNVVGDITTVANEDVTIATSTNRVPVNGSYTITATPNQLNEMHAVVDKILVNDEEVAFTTDANGVATATVKHDNVTSDYEVEVISHRAAEVTLNSVTIEDSILTATTLAEGATATLTSTTDSSVVVEGSANTNGNIVFVSVPVGHAYTLTVDGYINAEPVATVSANTTVSTAIVLVPEYLTQNTNFNAVKVGDSISYTIPGGGNSALTSAYADNVVYLESVVALNNPTAYDSTDDKGALVYRFNTTEGSTPGVGLVLAKDNVWRVRWTNGSWTHFYTLNANQLAKLVNGDGLKFAVAIADGDLYAFLDDGTGALVLIGVETDSARTYTTIKQVDFDGYFAGCYDVTAMAFDDTVASVLKTGITQEIYIDTDSYDYQANDGTIIAEGTTVNFRTSTGLIIPGTADAEGKVSRSLPYGTLDVEATVDNVLYTNLYTVSDATSANTVLNLGKALIVHNSWYNKLRSNLSYDANGHDYLIKQGQTSTYLDLNGALASNNTVIEFDVEFNNTANTVFYLTLRAGQSGNYVEAKINFTLWGQAFCIKPKNKEQYRHSSMQAGESVHVKVTIAGTDVTIESTRGTEVKSYTQTFEGFAPNGYYASFSTGSADVNGSVTLANIIVTHA